MRIPALARKLGLDPADVEPGYPLLYALLLMKSPLARRIRRAVVVLTCRAYDRWERPRGLLLGGVHASFDQCGCIVRKHFPPRWKTRWFGAEPWTELLPRPVPVEDDR